MIGEYLGYICAYLGLGLVPFLLIVIIVILILRG